MALKTDDPQENRAKKCTSKCFLVNGLKAMLFF